MDFQRQEWIVSRLNGYVMAMSSIDGILGDSNADAYVMDLDKNDLLGSLRSHIQQEPENQYIYDAISEIHTPWSRQLVVALDAFFFKQPFAILSDVESKRIKVTRERMVTRIENLIGLIVADDSSCAKIYRVEMHSNDGYVGCMHIFPLAHGFMVLKTISRI
jgi:hypothetical protein